jgi:hypothetical protein
MNTTPETTPAPVETPKAETPEAETPKVEEQKAEAPETEKPKAPAKKAKAKRPAKKAASGRERRLPAKGTKQDAWMRLLFSKKGTTVSEMKRKAGGTQPNITQIIARYELMGAKHRKEGRRHFMEWPEKKAA